MAGPATLVYRCDAGHAIGLGHLMRGLALADAVRKRHGYDVVFAGAFERIAEERLGEAGFRCAASGGKPDAVWLKSLLTSFDRPVLVCDVRTALRAEDLVAVKPIIAGLIVLDDASDRRLAADLAILPPTPTARALLWPGFQGRVEIGWQWTILGRPPLVPSRSGETRSGPPWRLLVTMGGADPNGLTLRAADALAPFAGELEPVIVLGPAFADRASQKERLREALPAARLVEEARDLRPLMARCDAALTSYGVTAQELAAAGVPALSLCLSDDHAQSAAALAETGACGSLGRFDLLTDRALAAMVMDLLRAPGRRAAMARIAPTIIDGRGAERIADEVARLVSAAA